MKLSFLLLAGVWLLALEALGRKAQGQTNREDLCVLRWDFDVGLLAFWCVGVLVFWCFGVLALVFWRWSFGVVLLALREFGVGVLAFWRFGVGLLALVFWRCVVGVAGIWCGLGCAFNAGFLALSFWHRAFGFSRCGVFSRFLFGVRFFGAGLLALIF